MRGDIHEEAPLPPVEPQHTAMSVCCGAAPVAHLVDGWGMCACCKRRVWFMDEEEAS
jgi:hypothetical protein